MPLLHVTSNVAIADRKLALQTLSAHMAKVLNKPESYVMVILNHKPDMLFAGTDEPCAYLEFKSIGLPQDQTQAFSKGVCQLLEKLMSVPSSRTYIEFADAERHMWGFNNKTFAR